MKAIQKIYNEIGKIRLIFGKFRNEKSFLRD